LNKALSQLPLSPLSASPEPANLPSWLHWLDSCPSTNSWAIDRASQLHHGDVIFTRLQTAGRGQHGRTWHAPTGVLTASFILDKLNSNLLTGLSLATGLAVIYAIEDLVPDCRDMLRLKWPNDVWINRRKLAGILCEAISDKAAAKTRAVVGIGINRCAEFDRAGLDTKAIGNAVSLHSISSSVPDELALLDRLRHYLLELADMFGKKDKPVAHSGLALLLPELRRRDALLGCNVSLAQPSETIAGQAAGIDKFGRLLLRLPDDRIQAFTSGRVIPI
jgi:BirA family transcriptional regulator, biotin operon repressor / biotin---[acetyl-CoA-carboxylase] ligase